MSVSPPCNLTDAIRQSGEDRLIDSYPSTDSAIRYILTTLDRINELSKARFGDAGISLTEESLVAEFQRNPLKIKAFLQALGGNRSPEMLLMAWRVIQGMEIDDIKLSYVRHQSFCLEITLKSPYEELSESYRSTNIRDFALLRHIGAHETNGRPVFNGFYPLRFK